MAKPKPTAPLAQAYCEKHPDEAAALLEAMLPEDRAALAGSLPPSVAGRVLLHLPHTAAGDVLDALGPGKGRALLAALEPVRAADLLLGIPEAARASFVEGLDPRVVQALSARTLYPPNSVGHLMDPRVVGLGKDLTVKDAVKNLRELARKHGAIFYVYVVDPEDRLLGVLQMRDLVLADPGERIESVMHREVFTVRPEMDQEEMLRLAATHRYMAVPVVSAENRLLGIVRMGELLKASEAEASEDLQKMFGAGGDESVKSPVAFALRKRLPWLQINLATAFAAAAVVGIFQDRLAALPLLAVFLPVVAGQAGNTGMQALAVAIRGLALREILPGNARRLLLKEAALGLLNGAAVAAVAALVILAWTGNRGVALGTAAAMVLSMLVAGVSGAGIPLLMKRLGLDPAQCSSIVLTTVTDVFGLGSFIVLASAFARGGSP